MRTHTPTITIEKEAHKNKMCQSQHKKKGFAYNLINEISMFLYAVGLGTCGDC